MVEAIHSLTQAQRVAQRQVIAVRVLCERRAQEEAKDEIRRQGKIKLSKVPRREIIAMARAAILDAAYRARLVAEARPIVDQWTAEGFFGKRAALSVRNVPELRTLHAAEEHQSGGNGQ